MTKIIKALASPAHMTGIVPLMLFDTLALVGDALRWWSLSFRDILVFTVLAYWLSVGLAIWHRDY